MNKLFFNLHATTINESIEDKGILKSCFMAGTPGAGKGYTINKIKSGQIEPRIVNTDKFSEFIANQMNVSLGEIEDIWDAKGAKIKKLSMNQLSLYINSLLPLWVDGTSSSPPSVFRRSGILKSIGYDTAMVWVDTNLDTALRRNAERERTVPEDFLIQVHERIKSLKDYYRSEFRYFFEIDNNDGALTNDIIIKSYKKVNNFFNSPVENPIGKDLLSKMIENRHKYLIDMEYFDIKTLKNLIKGWYK